MRIAVANWTARRFGGAENLIHRLLPHLQAAGHELAFFHECDEPPEREAIELPASSPSWCEVTLGRAAALGALRAWQPDLVFTHGLADPALESQLLDVAPGVAFAHGYYGTCITGTKSFTWPTSLPCSRRFGPACLALYYPRRIGGLSPLSMAREYRRQAARLALLHRYAAVVTASDHMRREFLRHGLTEARVIKVTLGINQPERSLQLPTAIGQPPRLLFVGRMDRLKGGSLLLDALRPVADALGGVHLDFVGDGPEAGNWRSRAASRLRGAASITVAWHGWVAAAELEIAYTSADLLVVPSVWPEPFGAVGPEAGAHGLPAAAFAVGGITEWLLDGVNGHLASADPPKPSALARAIVASLRDPDHHAALRAGAMRLARRFSLGRMVAELERVFRIAAGRDA